MVGLGSRGDAEATPLILQSTGSVSQGTPKPLSAASVGVATAVSLHNTIRQVWGLDEPAGLVTKFSGQIEGTNNADFTQKLSPCMRLVKVLLNIV